MGIRGLTTFIQNRSQLYMENYELVDSNIVIDGNSIASQLYRWHCKSNDCFGGDYDKYANVIIAFFKLLADCNVTPYVIFDGGYENRKIRTINDRMKNKIKSAQQLNSVTEGSLSVFPLFMREIFKDIVLKLNIKSVQCDFEGDTETACIARTLKCPVLSYDSDYFIFDVMYIPFSTFEMNIRKRTNKLTKQPYNYIACQVYRVDKFLDSFGGLNKDSLPLLAVLLGNDYVKRSVFSAFYKHVKIQKSNATQSDQQKRIKSLIVWLQNETVDSAIKKVLSRFKSNKRRFIAARIQNAIKGYSLTDSTLLEYLNINSLSCGEVPIFNIEKMTCDIDDDDEASSRSSSSSSSGSESEVDCELDTASSSSVPAIFYENFRKGLYPPCFINILLSQCYFCPPQVENGNAENSHGVSFDILAAINKILTGSDTKELICVGRKDECGHTTKYTLPVSELSVPSYLQVQTMDLLSRKSMLLHILNIDSSFLNKFLDLCPPSWSLFLIAIKFLASKSLLNIPLIYALLLNCIVLQYVDNQIGFYRSSRMFSTKFSRQIEQILRDTKGEANNSNGTIADAARNISYGDALLCLKDVIHYFQMDAKMKSNERLFDRTIVHTMAQFQSALMHIKYLNSLLNFPFENFIVSDFYDGTFVYNMTVNLLKRNNTDLYMTTLLKNSPTVLTVFQLVVSNLKDNISDAVVTEKPKRKRKRRKQKEETVEVSEKENNSEHEFLVDPNNRFSLLTL